MTDRPTTAGTATRVLTVADLLSRHPAADAPPAVPAPVAARGRGSRDPSARLAQRAGIAAGVLVAAGSVVGATVATTAPAAGTTGAGARSADRGPADPAPPAVPVLAPAAGTDLLDPGVAPTDTWVQVAFPDRPAGDVVPATASGDADAAGAPVDAAADGPADERTDSGDDDRDDDRDELNKNDKSDEKGKGGGPGRGGDGPHGGDDTEPTEDLVRAVTEVF
jgi:hypothetical protein